MELAVNGQFLTQQLTGVQRSPFPCSMRWIDCWKDAATSQ